MDYNKIIDDAATWVKQYFEGKNTSIYCFHDLTHTLDVVAAAQQMAEHYKLGEKERFIVIIATYFHDLGYFSGGAVGHELRSADLAESFLRQRDIDKDVIDSIKKCIMATHLPQTPGNLLESIVCDADLFHLGSDHFVDRNKLMRKEKKATSGVILTNDDWCRGTLSLMNTHHYHTTYAQQLLNDKKAENMAALREQENENNLTNNNEGEPHVPKGSKKKKEANDRPDRGIETMFRVTSTNNQRLSDMADNKANILLTVNSIILSVVIALLLRKLDNNVYLTIPTFMLLIVSLSTMVVAILATRPKIPDGKFNDEDVTNKKVNLLFFGNFYKMGLDEYYEGMKKVMEDREFLYGTLTRDVYSQGVVLGRKYKLLRLAYSIFMFGLISSVLAFLVAIIGYDFID
ncbi:Pycsar system effector family protein [Parapedobacter tibetensis]|uniref:Pycsar system effector family protein n=1 Tax=Parapedobacter tibetensis TaxID=2972951 RepID=UPI00214DBF2E|nr:Pycsar system effector family protein [Parapedobacter tibetensis]